MLAGSAQGGVRPAHLHGAQLGGARHGSAGEGRPNRLHHRCILRNQRWTNVDTEPAGAVEAEWVEASFCRESCERSNQ